MFKFVTVFVALFFIAATSAGLIGTHHVVHQPVLAKVGSVVHSSPSAVSHQSITQVHHNKAVVHDVVAPVLRTTVHSAPLLNTYHAPVVHHYASGPAHTPVVKTYHVAAAAPVVHHSVPVVHAAAPLVSAPVAYTLHH